MNEQKDETNMNRIEINLTSSGKVSWSVKAYGKTAEEINKQLDELIKIAESKRLQLQG